MTKPSEGLFKDLKGWQDVDPEVIAEIREQMEEGVEEIVEAVEARRKAAHENRHKYIRY